MITLYSVTLYTLILILICHHLCSGQAKPSKKTKVSKPAEDPKVIEPEQQVSASDASEKQPDDPAPDVSPEISDLRADKTNINSSHPGPLIIPKCRESS